jgi:hypothetical protein
MNGGEQHPLFPSMPSLSAEYGSCLSRDEYRGLGMKLNATDEQVPDHMALRDTSPCFGAGSQVVGP